MPCAIRPERLAVILCGGARAPDAAMLAETRERVQRAGLRPVQPQAKRQQDASCAPETAGLGPLGGIAAAVAACEGLDGSCLLAVPADMPRLNPRALQRLADIAEADGRGALFDLGPLPMALIVGPELRRAVQQAVECPAHRSLSGLAVRLGLPVVASLPDDGLDNLVTRRSVRQAAETTDS